MNETKTKKIPLVDLKAQYASIREEIDGAVASVIRDAAFVRGPYLEKFEREFAEYCGTKFAVGVNSGTDALVLALRACGVGPGDEVITVPNTFIATTEAITLAGAKVRFVDVDPETFTLDPAQLPSDAGKVRAIIPVHLYGHPAEMDAILSWAKERSIRVIGDAAQAHGSFYKDRKIGTLGDAVCFSFYPGKNLGAYGDGGAVVTDDPAIAEEIGMLRDHGRTQKYGHLKEGMNSRLDAIQAAVLSAKLPHLDKWTDLRRRHAARYGELLAETKGVELPREKKGCRPVYHLYVVRTEGRDGLRSHLGNEGIAAGIHYPLPLHRQPAYEYLGLPEGSFPVAERQAKTILSLPLFPELTEDQLQRVAHAVQEWTAG